jgi:death-on-curing protein
MDFLDSGIEREFKRWKEIVGPEDPYDSDDTIGLHDVLAAHFLVVDYFASKGFGVGGLGPRSVDLLYSAVSRQFTGFGGVRKWNGLYEHCATLLFGIVKDHIFHDANKRTALLATLSLLHRKKKIIDLPQKRLDGLMIAVAGNRLDAYFEKDARYKAWLEALAGNKDMDGIIHIISDFLRRNTRQRNDSARTVTYSELNQALRRHGFELRSPNGNYINVVRVEPPTRGKFFGLGSKPGRVVYLGQIGFPGWKDQISKSALKTVREATGLTTRNGCDSQVLFEHAEPLSALISEYAEPLKRLANK